jgi:hypothetical protein
VTLSRASLGLGAALAIAAFAACAPARSPSIQSAAEHTWRSKCGTCHVPVEPGTRSEAQLRTALARHRKRVRLTEPEWEDLTMFLAAKQP